MSEHTIIRYTAAPTKLDYQPYGTLCQVMKNDEGTETEYYIQSSSIESDPVWLSAQDLLFQVYKKDLMDPVFIQSLLATKELVREPGSD